MPSERLIYSLIYITIPEPTEARSRDLKLADLIDDHYAIQPTVLVTQKFNLSSEPKYCTINEEANINEFHEFW
jgi:hypothetical protein